MKTHRLLDWNDRIKWGKWQLLKIYTYICNCMFCVVLPDKGACKSAKTKGWFRQNRISTELLEIRQLLWVRPITASILQHNSSRTESYTKSFSTRKTAEREKPGGRPGHRQVDSCQQHAAAAAARVLGCCCGWMLLWLLLMLLFALFIIQVSQICT